MRDFRAALVQMDTGENIERNLEKIEGFVREACANGAQLIIFPERMEYLGEAILENAFEVPGKITDFLSELARKYGCYLHCGSIAERLAQKSANTTLLYGPDGEQAALYRKVHLFDVDLPDGTVSRESDETMAGEEAVTAELPFGKVGLSICYDLRFPGLYQTLSGNGAEILVVCANFTDLTGSAHWEPLLRARAIENTCYVLACGQCGDKYCYTAHGNSMVIDPWGRILARAGHEETILYADLKGEVLEQVRRQIPCLKNRRRDVYAL